MERFAQPAYVPIGYLFLPEPPNEELPVPDLRTVGSVGRRRPSPDLLATIYACQQRQAWYREYLEGLGEEPRDFVESAKLTATPQSVAANIRSRLAFSVTERRQIADWEKSLQSFRDKVDSLGILVMTSGVVGNNNNRPLDPDEFRGFALADDLAPLVFINGADAKAAQMFTLAHELAHIWLGKSAVGDSGPNATHDVEKWCNQVAAEVLVPLKELKQLTSADDALDNLKSLAQTFKVSTLVILFRLRDARLISQDDFQAAYSQQVSLFKSKDDAKAGGGDFYRTQKSRNSPRFVKALITSTLTGQTLFRDAYQMLGIKKEETFRKLGQHVGVGF